MDKKNSKKKAPSLQFYPNDWLTDVKLRMCDWDTRGFWMDLLCYMHNSEKYGYLIINGIVLDAKGIQKLTKISPKKFQKVMSELLEYGIIRQDESGAFYSKRLVKDFELKAKRRKAGRLGGNPNLKKKLLNQKDNQEDNQEDNIEVNHPSNQILTPSARNTSSSSSSSIKLSSTTSEDKPSSVSELGDSDADRRDFREENEIELSKKELKYSDNQADKPKKSQGKTTKNKSNQKKKTDFKASGGAISDRGKGRVQEEGESSVNRRKTASNQKKKPTLVTQCREIFENWWKNTIGTDFYWDGKSAKQMTNCISKIRFQIRKTNGLDEKSKISDDQVVEGWGLMLQAVEKSENLTWLKQDPTVAMINSKFDSVFKELKNIATNKDEKDSFDTMLDEYF